MKKLRLVVSVLVFYLFFSFSVNSIGATSGISILINGEKQSYSNLATLENGRTLVPLRGIFESLGSSVQYNSADKTIDAMKDNNKIWLKIGSRTARVNGKTVILDVPAKVENGRTIVPLRFISESLGENVNWNQQSRTVLITSNSNQNGNQKPIIKDFFKENSRTNPAEIGQSITAHKNDWLDGYQKYEIELLDVISGNDAWMIVQAGNMFNSPPDSGMKYVLAKFRVKVLELEKEPFTINHAKFNVVSKNGVKYNNWISISGLNPNLRTDIYTGGEFEGWTYFMVNQYDEPLAVYNQGWDDEIWFNINK